MNAAADHWQGRFGPEVEMDAGAGLTVYRRCALCGSHAMTGSLSAHARWCDKQRAELVLEAFDGMAHADRREQLNTRSEVRRAARASL